MPLRWSYESAIICQAKLNPLASAQEMLEARIQAIINLPRDQSLTEEQHHNLDVTKQALAVVSGLQDDGADAVVARLKRIVEGVAKGELDPDVIEVKSKKGVSAEEVFVNRKVLDLVTKAEMEREDYRRKSSPNVFFGTLQTLWSHKDVDKEGNPIEVPFRVNTLVINVSVMLMSMIVILVFLQVVLRRQLSAV